VDESNLSSRTPTNPALQDILDLDRADTLKVIESRLTEISHVLKPCDYFERIDIDPTVAHTLDKQEFPAATVYKITILPVPVDFTLWVEDHMTPQNKYELKVNESIAIERPCSRFYYTNDADATATEDIRIHIAGKWDPA